MKVKAQHLVDVVLAIAASTVAIIMVLNYLESSRARSTSGDKKYTVGEQLPNLDGVNFGGAERTLVLVLRSTCVFCTKSMPFYRRLSVERRAWPSLQIVGAAVEDPVVFGSYLREQNLRVDRVITLKPGVLRLSGTPTLILVDKSGHLVGNWIGELRPEGEREVMSAAGAYP
ncbi:MAG: hypothetical protein HYS05_01245 [Acidobacteria bacterium]|nr:hypothetical protein [Acidobacteriota bacterium]